MISDPFGWLPLKWRRPCLLCTRVHHRVETLMTCFLQHAAQLRREQESLGLSREYRESRSVDTPTQRLRQASPLVRHLVASGIAATASVTALSVLWSWALAAVVSSVGALTLISLVALHIARAA